jgi:hypothetical protein
MPDWNQDKLKPLKQIVENYYDFLNTGDSILIENNLSEDIILSRGKLTHGINETLAWFQILLTAKPLEFKLLDATKDLFSESEAQILMYYNIVKEPENEIFVESLFLKKENNHWKINRIFGISFEPESHKKYFDK